MWNFRALANGARVIRTGMLGFACLSSLSAAAEVSFKDQSKLTGEVVAMDEEGTISLSSVNSIKPLQIDAEKITKVDFGKPQHELIIPRQRLTLINGDAFPIEIRGLSETALLANSPALGDLEIPREMIDSLQLGMFSQNLIYRGPENLKGWKRDTKQSDQWKLDGGSFKANGQSLISRDMKLPEKFVLRFKMNWESNPNIRFSFADPLSSRGERIDRYFIQFASAGLEIKRESTGKSRFTTIAVVGRHPDEFANRELWVEVRMNRKRGRLDLYLNDQLEGRYTDPVPDIPTGTGISLLSLSPEESQLEVSDIEIFEWDDRGDRHRAEDRGNEKEDAIIGRNGERFGGKLISISDGEEGKIYHFKSDFQQQPMELPESEISTVFFKVGTPAASNQDFQGLHFRLHGRGDVQVSKCVFKDDTVSLTHPLLGELKVDRREIAWLERRATQKSKKGKSK